MEEFFSVIAGIAMIIFSVIAKINKQKKKEEQRASNQHIQQQKALHPGNSAEQQAQFVLRQRELNAPSGIAPFSPSVAPSSTPVNYYRNPVPISTPTLASQVIPPIAPMPVQLPMRPILQTQAKPAPQSPFDPEAPCALGGTHSAGHTKGTIPEGMSTMQPKPLQREALKAVDLGRQREKEQRMAPQGMSMPNVEQWTPPEELAQYGISARSGANAAYSPAQLREAIVLKEILDAPISRRRARRVQV